MRAAVALALLAGCYAPAPRAGAPCSPARSCPDGLVCRAASNTCETTDVDARPPTDTPLALDSAPGDAPVDGPFGPPPPSALRQQVGSVNGGAGMLTATLPMAPVAGDVLVLVGGNPAGPLDSVTGGGVATWTRAVRSTVHLNVEVWYGVTNGLGSAVTITRGGGGDGPETMWVGELTHLAGRVDDASARDGTTSPATAGSVTATSAYDLLVFAVADGLGNTFGNPAPGFWMETTPPTGSISTTQGVWLANRSTAGTSAPTVSETSHQWDAALVAFPRE